MTIKKVSVVIPALNEESNIHCVIVEALKSNYVNEIVVSIDSRTIDNTVQICNDLGVKVITSATSGFGNGMKQGIAHASNDLIFKTDADIRDFDHKWIDRSVKAWNKNCGLIKTNWPQVNHTRSVTSLVVKPILKRWIPELKGIGMPLSGLYLFDKNKIKWKELRGDWSFDLDLLLQVSSLGLEIRQIKIPEIVDRRKVTKDLVHMADEVVDRLHSYINKLEKLDNRKVLLLMAHPDDAEIWCGGTIAQICLNGGEVKVIIVTGNQTRQVEAINASKLLPNYSVVFLNQEQFSNFITEENAEQIASEIHSFKPDTLITHQPEDFHIDHRNVSELALLSLLLLHQNNYPQKVYYCNTYFQKDRFSNSFSPDTYVDISEFFDLKRKLISCHKSQRIEYYIEMVKTMDRMNGIKSSTEYAETFLTCSTHLTNKALISI